MKRTLAVLLGVLFAGLSYESTGAGDDLMKRVEALERRVAELEEGKCRCPTCKADARRRTGDDDERKPSKEEARSQSAPTEKELAKKKAAEREKYGPTIKAFVKDYFGADFGESIERFPKKDGKDDKVAGLHGREHRITGEEERKVSLHRKFWYFEQGTVTHIDGKITGFCLEVTLDGKYSDESCDAEFEKVKTRFVTAVLPGQKGKKWNGQKFGGYFVVCRKSRARKYEVVLCDFNIIDEQRKKNRIERTKERPVGEALPEVL